MVAGDGVGWGGGGYGIQEKSIKVKIVKLMFMKCYLNTDRNRHDENVERHEIYEHIRFTQAIRAADSISRL